MRARRPWARRSTRTSKASSRTSTPSLIWSARRSRRACGRGLLAIPYGQTRSYGQQAHQINHPTATRAVAAANGQNKIAVIVPCHRVIGSDGRLTGYGGGLPRKEWLLQLERSGAVPRDLFP